MAQKCKSPKKCNVPKLSKPACHETCGRVEIHFQPFLTVHTGCRRVECHDRAAASWGKKPPVQGMWEDGWDTVEGRRNCLAPV